MFTFDQEESPHTLKPTDFDIIRLESMDIGERLEAESGNWVVLRYEKEYILSSKLMRWIRYLIVPLPGRLTDY